MQEAYAQVIDLIADNATDYRAIGLLLAKVSPAAFLTLHDATKGGCTTDSKAKMNRDMAHLLKQDKFVEAIKHCRTVTGWGLKEAKDYADNLRERMERGESIPVAVGVGDLLAAFKAALKTDDAASSYPDAGSY